MKLVRARPKLPEQLEHPICCAEVARLASEMGEMVVDLQDSSKPTDAPCMCCGARVKVDELDRTIVRIVEGKYAGSYIALHEIDLDEGPVLP